MIYLSILIVILLVLLCYLIFKEKAIHKGKVPFSISYLKKDK